MCTLTVPLFNGSWILSRWSRGDASINVDLNCCCNRKDINCTSYMCILMILIIHEMLRKTRQGNTTQQKDKATQHNTTRPKKLFSKKK